MKKIMLMILMLMIPMMGIVKAEPITLKAPITINLEELDKAEEFVRQQMNVQEMKSYNLEGIAGFMNVPKPGGAKNVRGLFDPKTNTIYYDGKSMNILVHELAHLYGADEKRAKEIQWLYEDNQIGSIQKNIEKAIALILSPVMFPVSLLGEAIDGENYWKEDFKYAMAK